MKPSILFRGFTSRKFAVAFCEGSVRFSTLAHYKNTDEPSRIDETEGLGVAQRNGEVLIADSENKSIRSKAGIENLQINANVNERFICCFSFDRDYKNLAKKFGSYIVIVHSPDKLFHDLDAAINSDGGLQKNPPFLEADYVRYDKDTYVGELTKPEEIRKLSWLQKPESYSDDKEYRYQFWFSFHELINSPSHYFLEIGNILDYCEVIEVDS